MCVSNTNKTMREDLIKYVLESRGIDIKDKNEFKRIIKEEGYETESIYMDIRDTEKSQSNIISICSSSMFEDIIRAYFKHQQRMFLQSVYCLLIVCIWFS